MPGASKGSRRSDPTRQPGISRSTTAAPLDAPRAPSTPAESAEVAAQWLGLAKPDGKRAARLERPLAAVHAWREVLTGDASVPLAAAAEGLVRGAADLLAAGEDAAAVRALDEGYLAKAVGGAPGLEPLLLALTAQLNPADHRLGPWDKARLHRALAIAFSYRQSDWDGAVGHLSVAQALLADGLPDTAGELAETRTHLGRALFNLAQTYEKEGNAEASADLRARAGLTYRLAREGLEGIAAPTARDRRTFAHLALNEATAIEKAAPEKALAQLEAALAQLDRPSSREVEVQLLYNGGRLLNVLGKAQPAHFERALTVLREAQGKVTDPLAEGITLQQLGVALSGTGQRDAAKEHLTLALGAFERAKSDAGMGYTRSLLEGL